MSYKTVLVHVDQSKHAPERIRVAASVAAASDAHLVGAAMTGVSRYVFEGGAMNPQDAGLAHQIDGLRAAARRALDAFDKLAGAAGAASVEARLVDDDAAGGIALQARYADLVVVGQVDPDEAVPGMMSDFVEYVTLNCARPVLALPYVHKAGTGGAARFAKPVVAWDASMGATRAITGALPLLRQAGCADLVVFNPDDQPGAHGARPGDDLALYLARHGIEVNVINGSVKVDTGSALLSLAADLGSDLLVMGAYGHSRFREVVLGGATRTVLQSMTLPVLMAH